MTTPDLTGTAFAAPDVAANYVHRPPYAERALRAVAQAARGHDRLLDLGCGEGKVARGLVGDFAEVWAVDPSAPMLALGRTLPGGDAANLRWIAATAETAPLDGLFDMVTFASSIHWMDPGLLFRRLRPHLRPEASIAVISGDEPADPPWEEAWQAFLTEWVPKVSGLPMGAPEWTGQRDAYLDHLRVVDVQTHLSDPFRQTVAEFIRCQQSRNTFAPARLGAHRGAFEEALTALLAPHADAAGLLTYRVATQVTLARPPVAEWGRLAQHQRHAAHDQQARQAHGEARQDEPGAEQRKFLGHHLGQP
ncbi:MAG: class I SAM-dependent methyltransferase [Shimia sp.]